MKHLAFTALVSVPMMLFSVALTLLRIGQGRFFHAGCRLCSKHA
jgi:hypothetical protein